MSFLQLKETSVRQAACITPRGMSQVFLLTAALLITASRIKWAGHVAVVEEKKGAYRVSMGQSDGTRPLGKVGLRLEDNINTDLKKWIGGMGWIDLAQDRERWQAFVNAVMNLRV